MSDYQVTCIPQEEYNKEEIYKKLSNYFTSHGWDFQDKTILLKPSFVFAISDKEKALGTNTHNAVVAGTAKALSELGAKNIMIAEHKTIGPARYGFMMVGIKKEVKGIKNVKLTYLDEHKSVKVPVKDSFIPDHVIKYPKMLIDGSVDYFISLPKLKSNVFAGITLSVKNNYGLINKYERLRYHDDRLHKNLADIELIRQPDLTISDAIVAGEGQGPMEINNVTTDMLIVGKNPLAVDAVCCYMMDEDPMDIEHLKLLHERGIGPLSLENIEIENNSYLESKKTTFQKPDHTLAMTPDIKVYKGKKACEPGCLGMIRHILDGYWYKNGWDSLGELNIILGEDVDISEEELKSLDKKRTIVYGNCSKKYKKYGTFFKGCPPDYTKGLIKLWLGGPLKLTPWFEFVSPVKFGLAWARHILNRIFRI